jgi:hypothetical protein
MINKICPFECFYTRSTIFHLFDLIFLLKRFFCQFSTKLFNSFLSYDICCLLLRLYRDMGRKFRITERYNQETRRYKVIDKVVDCNMILSTLGRGN